MACILTRQSKEWFMEKSECKDKFLSSFEILKHCFVLRKLALKSGTYRQMIAHFCDDILLAIKKKALFLHDQSGRYPGYQRLFMRGFRFRVFKLFLAALPLVSSAEQREKNLWYPGYLEDGNCDLVRNCSICVQKKLSSFWYHQKRSLLINCCIAILHLP